MRAKFDFDKMLKELLILTSTISSTSSKKVLEIKWKKRINCVIFSTK